MGYDVPEPAGSSEEALCRVEAWTPDLILMDIVLEGSSMDGIETARRILAQFEVPVIFVTAFADDITLNRAKTANPFAYILKPFNERELYSAIELALHRHRSESETKKRDAILFAISFSVEGYLRQLEESRKAQENPSKVKASGIRELLEHIRIAANATSAAVFQLETGTDKEGDARVQVYFIEPGSGKCGLSPDNEYAYLNFSSALWKFLLASGNAIAGDVTKLRTQNAGSSRNRGFYPSRSSRSSKMTSSGGLSVTRIRSAASGPKERSRDCELRGTLWVRLWTKNAGKPGMNIFRSLITTTTINSDAMLLFIVTEYWQGKRHPV